MAEMKYKFIHVKIDDEEEHAGRPIYYVHNNRSGDMLAMIFWYVPWRKWAARFVPDTVWTPDCLADVNKAVAEISKIQVTNG
jgi:hypothetical protein